MVNKFDIDGKPMDGENQWMLAVGELYNIRNGPSFKKACEDLAKQRLSKKEWVEINTHLEFNTLCAIKNFYHTMWLQNAKKHKIDSIESYWRCDLPNTYQEWITRDDAIPFLKYWSQVYPEKKKH